jgi:nucleotide-binding universal stress UspA family protein
MKILIPADGTENANRAVDYVVASRDWLKEVPHVLLLNVQWNIASGNVKLFISKQTVNDYYQEMGVAALATARSKLDAAGIPYSFHISVGTPAEAIVRYATDQGVDQIVMGAGEQRTLASFLLGSVVNKVLHLASVPVLLVK